MTTENTTTIQLPLPEPRYDLLTLLVEHLDKNVKEDEFNLGVWWCGTQGCIIGHGIVGVPQIAELVELKVPEPLDDDEPHDEEDPPQLVPTLKDDPTVGIWGVIMRVFQVSKAEADFLFSPTYYIPDYSYPSKEIPKSIGVVRLRAFIDQKVRWRKFADLPKIPCSGSLSGIRFNKNWPNAPV